MKLFIAAGHGATDTGATFQGITERDEAIQAVNKALDILKTQDLKDNQVVLVPHELELTGAVSFINSHTSDPEYEFCMEVHLNSNSGTPGTGTESYYGGQKFAAMVHQEVVAQMGLKDRGLKEGNYLYFNNMTKPLSCLVELGFINNPDDLGVVRARAGRALASAILKVLTGNTLQDTGTVPAQVTPTNTRIVTVSTGDGVRVRTSPVIDSSNIITNTTINSVVPSPLKILNGLPVNTKVEVIADAIHGAVVGMSDLWFKLAKDSAFIWSGGTDAASVSAPATAPTPPAAPTTPALPPTPPPTPAPAPVPPTDEVAELKKKVAQLESQKEYLEAENEELLENLKQVKTLIESVIEVEEVDEDDEEDAKTTVAPAAKGALDSLMNFFHLSR